ncbi:MAG: acyl-CoA synthetase [Deltaproteobacteria bacterium]|nr:acyl-CoA synthetase [Deltaproteobacteria bacterium]
MHPSLHAKSTPDKAAYVLARSGEVVTYRQLDERSNQCAHLLRRRGLRPGSAIAVLLANDARFHESCWAAQRSGLYYTPLSTHLTPPEIEYIAKDCGAEVLIASHAFRDVAEALVDRLPGVHTRLMIGGTARGFESYESLVAAEPSTPIADECEGQDMLYSSGTTGYPKGIRVPLSNRKVGDLDPLAAGLEQGFWQIRSEDVYLSPAPLYHSAPLRCTMAMMRLGTTSVIMEKFDPEEALALIERHRVTASQWVPTMFVRMLKLPEESRRRYDLASHRIAVHAAAPCPVPVKEKMIEWWGPMLHEYYAATEANGSTAITSEEWLAHKGSVGKPFRCVAHILDEEGRELGPREIGTVYFEGGASFAYHNDPEKTAGSYSREGWSTVGDMGWLDEEGYLYLSDRRAYMIISGGVNIYPQEAENVLIGHPRVADVAVIGVPNEEFGEEVKAVVEPVDMAEAGPDLEHDLLEWCRARLARIKCPRSVDFEAKLPREENGKLYKRRLRDRYWRGHATRIV